MRLTLTDDNGAVLGATELVRTEWLRAMRDPQEAATLLMELVFGNIALGGAVPTATEPIVWLTLSPQGRIDSIRISSGDHDTIEDTLQDELNWGLAGATQLGEDGLVVWYDVEAWEKGDAEPNAFVKEVVGHYLGDDFDWCGTVVFGTVAGDEGINISGEDAVQISEWVETLIRRYT